MLERLLHLYLTIEGNNPTMLERISESSPPLGGNLNLENTNLLPEVLKLHSSQWLGQYIGYMLFRRNILDLHYSFLHHILDIVILDLDMLRLTTSRNFGCHSVYK